MPYGLKRGDKSPGEFGAIDIAGLAVSGSVGIIAALITDYQQKGETSAIYTVNQWAAALSSLLGFGNPPLWTVVAGLVALGAASIFYFQPITRQGAFAQGFGLLAVMMTAVPADLVGGIQSAGDENFPELLPATFQVQSASAIQATIEGNLTGRAARTGVEIIQAQARAEARYDVEISIVFPGGLPPDVETMIKRGVLRGRLHNKETGATFNLFRTAGGAMTMRGDSIFIKAGVPARSQSTDLWLRVECEGYLIEEQRAEAFVGRPLTWTVTMKPTNTPLVLQRLNKSFWF